MLMEFFVGKNLRIARDRAWDQTLKSRGKDAEFWGPYVEEWQVPPRVDPKHDVPKWQKLVTGRIGRIVIKKCTRLYIYFREVDVIYTLTHLLAVILLPLNFYPIVGIMISSAIKALSTARYLHKSVCFFLHSRACIFTYPRAWQYFEYKKMTPLQIATYMDEHKYDYHGAFYFFFEHMESSWRHV